MNATFKIVLFALSLGAMPLLTGCGAVSSGSSDSGESQLSQSDYGDSNQDRYDDSDKTPTNNSGGGDSLPKAAPASYDVQVSWDIPTRRANGSDLQLSEIDGYNIFYYREGDSEPVSVYIDSPTKSSEILEDLEPGNYRFKVSAVDTSGLVSDYSQVLAANLQ